MQVDAVFQCEYVVICDVFAAVEGVTGKQKQNSEKNTI
jgi:hypothetical protein